MTAAADEVGEITFTKRLECKYLCNTHPNEDVVSPPTARSSSEPVDMYCIRDRVGSEEGKSNYRKVSMTLSEMIKRKPKRVLSKNSPLGSRLGKSLGMEVGLMVGVIVTGFPVGA